MMSTTEEFFQAAYKDDIECVSRLLADEPALAQSSSSAVWENATPLTLAALGGHMDVARLLVERGATVNPISNDGSALLMAVWGNHEPMVRYLLEAGADVNLVSASGETALMAAAYKGLVTIAELLLDSWRSGQCTNGPRHDRLLQQLAAGPRRVGIALSRSGETS